MKEIRVKKAHDINQLHEELLVTVSELRPREEGGERVAVMAVQSAGDEIILLVPDEVDEAEIQKIIKAHSPKPKGPPPDLDALLDDVEKAGSWQAFKTALVAYERAKHPERRRKGG